MTSVCSGNAARVWAVVPAAGSGSRMGSVLPKQYLPIAGKCVAEHTLEALLGVAAIGEIVVAIAADDPHWHTLSAPLRQRVRVVTGGADRAQSVLNAMGGFSVTPDRNDWILVHDMARPCIRVRQIEAMIETLGSDPVGGLLAIPVVDTLKRADASACVAETVERDALWRAQTPQMFRFGLLEDALRSARERGFECSDEAMALELMGYRPRLVPGSADNIKLTRVEDLRLANYYLAANGEDDR